MTNVRFLISNFVNSWYGVVVILGFVLIAVCRAAINDLLNKVSISFRKGGIEVSNQQSEQDMSKDVIKSEEYGKVQQMLKKLEIEKIEELEEVVNNAFETIHDQNKELEDAETAFNTLLELKEAYEFAYLNIYLVERSKQALLTLYNYGSSTKELFISSIDVGDSSGDTLREREAVCSVLLSHELVEIGDNSLYNVSDKGERFLRFIDLM